jgi:hypothetical protein
MSFCAVHESSTGDAFKARVASDIEVWTKVVSGANGATMSAFEVRTALADTIRGLPILTRNGHQAVGVSVLVSAATISFG